MAETTKRYAVVTGSNRGIGLEICRQLAVAGITVVLTARDDIKGFEAAEELKKENGFSDQDLVFHQLDVSDPASISSFANFVKSQFGKLDILNSNSLQIPLPNKTMVRKLCCKTHSLMLLPQGLVIVTK